MKPTPNPKILQIPLPGGSGNAPTGAVQFQDDWPGLFIRGDDAIRMVSAIRDLQERISNHEDVRVRNAIGRLGELLDIMKREVVVSGHVPTLKPLS